MDFEKVAEIQRIISSGKLPSDEELEKMLPTLSQIYAYAMEIPGVNEAVPGGLPALEKILTYGLFQHIIQKMHAAPEICVMLAGILFAAASSFYEKESKNEMTLLEYEQKGRDLWNSRSS